MLYIKPEGLLCLCAFLISLIHATYSFHVILLDLVTPTMFGASHSSHVVWGVVLDHSNAGIVGSNPAQGMDICLRLSVLCCPVKIEVLWWAGHSSKESYQMSKQLNKAPVHESAKVLQGLYGHKVK
jgi:hypothetical protein